MPHRCASNVLGDRDGVIDGHVARIAEAEIDDEILDHEPLSAVGGRVG